MIDRCFPSHAIASIDDSTDSIPLRRHAAHLLDRHNAGQYTINQEYSTDRYTIVASYYASIHGQAMSQ